MIVKIQVIINVDPQKFNTIFISYRAARDLIFQVLFSAMIRLLFSAFDITLLF